MKKGVSQYLTHLKEKYPNFVRYLDKLTPREQLVIAERLNGKTLNEVGKMLTSSYRIRGRIGVTRSRVREIEAKACRKLGYLTREGTN